jgi:hypothetical protein
VTQRLDASGGRVFCIAKAVVVLHGDGRAGGRSGTAPGATAGEHDAKAGMGLAPVSLGRVLSGPVVASNHADACWQFTGGSRPRSRLLEPLTWRVTPVLELLYWLKRFRELPAH